MKKPNTIKITKRILTEDEADKTTALRRIVIKRDNDPLNPREDYDNLFTIHSDCPRYLSSDNDAYDPIEDYGRCPDEAKPKDGVCAFPFYAYIHSGMALSMSSFADKWDSGCAGFIYVEKDKFCKEMGLKRFSRAKAYKIAKGEIETLNQYVNNEVFGFVEQTRESPRRRMGRRRIVLGFLWRRQHTRYACRGGGRRGGDCDLRRHGSLLW